MRGLNIINGISILEDEALVQASLDRLFFTKTGGIPGAPQVGSRLLYYFDEPFDEVTAQKILDEVETLIDLYEPRITLLDIKVTLQTLKSGKEGILIELEYEFVASREIGKASVARVKSGEK